MLTALRPQRRTGRGFTLVELAGVILVIMILAAIAIPTFQVFQERSRGSAIDTGADRVINSMYALSQQSNSAANKVDDLADAFKEIAEVDRVNYGVQVYTGLAFENLNTTSETRLGDLHARVVQRIGDKVRAGCIFFPPNSEQGEMPFWARHGNDVPETLPSWLSLSAGTIDIMENTCVQTGAVDVPVEGTFIEAGADPVTDPASADMDSNDVGDIPLGTIPS